ncbi:MAG: tagO [Bacillales bacterium]|jgi:UDP-GlcNAc:undecaprenyl-phosphate GlcNAc-1-phosphate transferase|nr:tagO [Bacillales bacterium]
MYNHAIIGFIVAFVVTIIATPFVIKLAICLKVTDSPNERKIHTKVMPRMGGFAIFLGVAAGFFASGLYNEKVFSITIGALLMIILGLLDDKFGLSAGVKLTVQILIAILVVRSGLYIETSQLGIPYLGDVSVEGSIWGSVITVIWIVGITNAINLIDGLDGLSAGISTIGIGTIAVMAYSLNKMLILSLCLIIMGATIAFLFYNFHPAKIFMGDTGALFLGYSISVLSLMGAYKSVTLFSVIVPLIILGVPIFDMLAAILRRIAHKRPISSPDKGHLHHRLIDLGLSQRTTVLLIYALGLLFSSAALLLSKATLYNTLIILVLLLIILEIIAEFSGIVHSEYKPIIKLLKKIFIKKDARKSEQ